jgi:hypothetical protein
MNFYPWIRVQISTRSLFTGGRVIALPDSNPTRCHPYSPSIGSEAWVMADAEQQQRVAASKGLAGRVPIGSGTAQSRRIGQQSRPRVAGEVASNWEGTRCLVRSTLSGWRCPEGPVHRRPRPIDGHGATDEGRPALEWSTQLQKVDRSIAAVAGGRRRSARARSSRRGRESPRRLEEQRRRALKWGANDA